MKHIVCTMMMAIVASTLASGSDAGAQDRKSRLTDAQVRTILIEESIAEYAGNCPCPYHRARNGSRCGRRSAYDREGGAAPLCYPTDVSSALVKEYRQRNPPE